MISYKVEVTGLPDVIRKLEELRVQNIPRVIRQIQWSIALKAKERAVQTTSGPEVGVRSGLLRRHINLQQPQWDGEACTWGLPVGGTKEANLQSRIGAFLEKGGTITHKKAKMLRIPLAAAMTGAGVDRFAGVPLRTVPGFRLIKSKKGNLLLIRGDKGEPAVPWYVLKESVTIKAHPWFARAVRETQTYIPRIIQAHLNLLEKQSKAKA